MSSDLPIGSVLSYRVSLVAAIVFAVVYLVLGSLLIWRAVTRNGKWGLCLGIGAVCQGIGFVIRIAFRQDQASIPLYAVQQLVIVVSPAAYFAFNYILFGRLTYNMVRDARIHSTHSLTFFKPQHMGAIFVTSDVVTFIMQMAGGGMQAVPGLTDVGTPIFLAGIVAQFASYVLFSLLVLRMRFRVLPKLHRVEHLGPRVDRILLLLAWSSIWIFVRCVFRTIELSEGYDGPLYNTEIYFLLLDALPLVLAISHYIIWWPSNFLDLQHNEQGFPHVPDAGFEMSPKASRDYDVQSKLVESS